MTPKRLLVASAFVPLAALLALMLAGIPGGPRLSPGTAGLTFLAGLAVTAQCAWLVVARWRSNGTVLLVRNGGLAWNRSEPAGRRDVRRVLLQVAAGQAVVLERLGQFSRVLGPGTVRLLPGETVFRVVPTEPRTISGAVDCSTKDGIPIAVEYELRAHLQSSGADDAARESAGIGQGDRDPGLRQPANWSAEAVARAAYEDGSWEGLAISLGRSVLRELMARTYLSELLAGGGAADRTMRLPAIGETARLRMANASRAFGVAIPDLRVSALRLPPAFAQAAMAVWQPEATPSDASKDGRGHDGTAGPDWRGEVVIAPLVARSGFTTLRKASRDVVMSLSASSAEAAGRVREFRRLTGGPESVALNPGASTFVLELRDSGFADLGAVSGDLVVLVSSDALTDGQIVAVLVDGRTSLRRCGLNTDHALLSSASARTLPVAVVETEALHPVVAARYRGEGVAVDVRLSSQVKVIGAARAVLRPAASAKPTPPESATTEPPMDLGAAEAES